MTELIWPFDQVVELPGRAGTKQTSEIDAFLQEMGREGAVESN